MSTVHAILLLTAFTLLLAAPFLFGFVELRRRKDAGPLEVRHDNTRNPRQFAFGFRAQIQPLLADGAAPRPALFRGRDRIEVRDRIAVRAGTERDGILAARRNAVIGERAVVREVFAGGDAIVEPGARVRALACDGLLVLAGGCRVERWVDAAHASIGPGCDLGVSASALESLRISHGCVFSRLWGLPVETLGNGATNGNGSAPSRVQEEVVWARTKLTLPPQTDLAQDVVAYGGVEIGSGSTIAGSVKAHGPVVVGAGARVDGHVIARGDVRIGREARVLGNVFAEGHVHLAPRASVGSAGKIRSVYSADEITLAPDVTVFGWVVAERRGRVLG